MHIFILGTGRCGSVTFIRACKHISNFTCGHESKARMKGPARLDFPDNHIEADNRLGWFLGGLQARYGNDAFYVHLKRDRDATAKSFERRFYNRTSIAHAFTEGIQMTIPETLDKKERLQCCYDYVDTITANIEHFLKDKTNKMEVKLESISDDFLQFWEAAGAEGDKQKALDELDIKHNASGKRFHFNVKYSLYFPVLRLWRKVTNN